MVDYLNVRVRNKEQEEEKKLWEEQQAELIDIADADGEEGFKPEEKVWELHEPQPFLTNKVSYVVCLNTMG